MNACIKVRQLDVTLWCSRNVATRLLSLARPMLVLVVTRLLLDGSDDSRKSRVIFVSDQVFYSTLAGEMLRINNEYEESLVASMAIIH